MRWSARATRSPTREPGRRESRFAHLCSGPVENAGTEPAEAAASAPARIDHDGDRLTRLEQRVGELTEELVNLKKQIGLE